MTYTFDDNIVSDLHKDAYGFRPGESFWRNWAVFNPEQKQAMWDSLCDTLERETQYERERQERAEHDVEVRIQQLMSAGAKTRAQAVRWLDEAEETNGDIEYLEYKLGLRYGYFRKTA